MSVAARVLDGSVVGFLGVRLERCGRVASRQAEVHEVHLVLCPGLQSQQQVTSLHITVRVAGFVDVLQHVYLQSKPT